MTCLQIRAAMGGIIAAALCCPAARADHLGLSGGPGASGSIATLSASTLPRGKGSAAVRFNLLKPDQLADAELAARAGRHIHAHNADYVLGPSLGLAYGASDNLTLALSLPYLTRRDIRAGTHHHAGGVATNGVEELGSSSGLGDAILLGQLRVLGDDDAPWQAALFAGLKVPTGATHVLDGNGERFETEHQPGTGSWDPLLGLAVSRRFERISLDASLLYQVSTTGAQATRLGNRAQYGLGVAYSLGPRPHHHEHEHEQEHGHEHGHGHDHHDGLAADLVLELNGEWEGRQRVGGAVEAESGGHVVYLSPGLRLKPAPDWSAQLSVGVPVLQRIRLSHPENRYRIAAGIARAF
jgi:hypothetical protein